MIPSFQIWVQTDEYRALQAKAAAFDVLHRYLGANPAIAAIVEGA